MVRAFSNACELAGRVKKADYNLRYATPKWEYTNPKDDVASDLDEIAGGLSSFSEKLRSRGYEPDEVFEELAEDIDKLRKLGILDVILIMRKGKQMNEDATSPPVR